MLVLISKTEEIPQVNSSPGCVVLYYWMTTVCICILIGKKRKTNSTIPSTAKRKKIRKQ